jgi:hypothetical protein
VAGQSPERLIQCVGWAGRDHDAGPGAEARAGLRDLVIYGMIIVQLVAPVPIAGLLEKRSAATPC